VSDASAIARESQCNPALAFAAKMELRANLVMVVARTSTIFIPAALEKSQTFE
jgi:hypothetical protein